MAEFCLDCFNKLHGCDYSEAQVCLEDDFCEGCAQWKPCVVELYPKPVFQQLCDKLRQLFKKNNH